MGSLNKKASGAQCFIMALGLFWDIATGLPWTPNGVGSLEPKEYCIFLPGAHYLTINSPNGADSSLNKLLLLLQLLLKRYPAPRITSRIQVGVGKSSSWKLLKMWWKSLMSEFKSRWWQVASFDEKYTLNYQVSITVASRNCPCLWQKSQNMSRCLSTLSDKTDIKFHRAYDYSCPFGNLWIHIWLDTKIG